MKQVVEPATIATVRMQSLERAGSQPDNSTIKGKRLGGLLLRKQRWGLSWTGWFVFIVVLMAAGAVFILNIHPFLAVTARENTKVLDLVSRLQQSLDASTKRGAKKSAAKKAKAKKSSAKKTARRRKSA